MTKKTKQSRPSRQKKKASYEQAENPPLNKAEEPLMAYASVIHEETKNQRLELRLTKFQKDVISKASGVSGFKNVSDYVLHIAINDSRNVIREQQLFELSERDRVAFMETLANAPAPGRALKKAKAGYLSFLKNK